MGTRRAVVGALGLWREGGKVRGMVQSKKIGTNYRLIECLAMISVLLNERTLKEGGGDGFLFREELAISRTLRIVPVFSATYLVDINHQTENKCGAPRIWGVPRENGQQREIRKDHNQQQS